MGEVLSMAFGRLRNRLMLGVLVFLAVAVIVNSVVIVQRQEALGRVSRYNLTWLLSQAAHEVVRLQDIIATSALPDSPIDSDAVALRLDVVLNRLVLLRTGEAAEFLDQRPDLKRAVDDLETALKTVERLSPQLPDPKIALQMREELEPLVPKMIQMAAAANVLSGDIVAKDQRDLSLQHWLLTGLLVTASVIIVVLLYRFASSQRRSRAELEMKISERTAELRELLDFQTATSEVLKVISRSTFDIAPVSRVVLETVTRLCRVQVAALYRFEEGALRWMAGYGTGPQNQQIRTAAPESPGWKALAEKAAHDGQTVSVVDAASVPEFCISDIPGVGRARTMLGIPMTRDGKLVGVLVLARDKVLMFSDKQVEVATVLADQAALAIENVRLIDEIRDKSHELEKALQHKSQFLATMSHELRTPMNGVLGMIDVLEAEGPGKNQARTLAMMRDSAQVLLRNINDLLDYSRIEAGALALEDMPFGLRDLIDGAIQVFQTQAARKGLTLVGVVSPDAADAAFMGDATRVRQIIFNLLSNALKFTDTGGVMLRASAEPAADGLSRVLLQVSDTGIGISSEQQSRLFKPFSQVDSSITRRYGGSGLGLSIVKQLAELMSGDVSLSSLPGAGATFTVTLKLKPAIVEPKPATIPEPEYEPESFAPAANTGRGRVLVVDDNPTNCEVLLRQLKILGVSADPAADGLDGFQAWRKGAYDMVFADIHMPVVDGFSMTASIRTCEAKEGRGRTPIVAVSADALAGEEERCRVAGMDDFLSKPVAIDALRKTVQRWLQPAKPEEEPVIDPTVLDSWVEEDSAARREILAKFKETVAGSTHDLEKAMALGDLAKLRSLAHRLRSGAQSVGARPLSKSAADLESAAKSGDRPACEGHFGHVVAQIDRVRAEISG
jgi:signal transduction histidine kinase/CheY-like chemotaxis protein/HPt (histidine-containing phosphotransfer) domain-containing protein